MTSAIPAATLLESALAAHAAGLCVVPPRMDGSKRPLPEQWRSFQENRPDPDQLRRWYAGGLTGIGAVPGAVSGNLEVLEFDDADTYRHFKDVADEAGLGPIIARLERGYVEASPGGGIHWLYRCDEIAGNTKLATRPGGCDDHGRPLVKTLIETRGEGGFIVMAPSNGKVHPTGRAYRLLAGNFSTIPTLSPEERRDLFALARTFHVPDPAKIRDPRPAGAAPGERPGDTFNARANWSDVLAQHGWQRLYERAGTTYWRRPGKGEGVSAATNWQGRDFLYVWSSSTPFDTETPYSKFAAYALLEHAGDMKAAATALAKQGYGGPKASEPARPSAKPNPTRFTAAELLKMTFPDPVWLLPDVLPETGLYLLCGKPKAGKSWFALALAMALAQGGAFLSRDTPRRKTLYFALEDTPRRLHNRLSLLHPYGSPDDLADLEIRTAAPRLGKGLEEDIRQAAADGFSVVFLDTLQKIRPPAAKHGTQYGEDYAVVGSIKQVADDCGICIVLVHHVRKAESADDPHDDVSGTNGIAGAADGSLIIRRVHGKPEAVLHVTGRDLPDNELGLRFEDGLWTFAGTAAEVRTTAEQAEIIDALKPYGSEGATVKTVCDDTGKQRRNVAKLLGKLVDAKRVRVRRAKPADFFAVCDGPMSGDTTGSHDYPHRERGEREVGENEKHKLSSTGSTGSIGTTGSTGSIPKPGGGTAGTAGTLVEREAKSPEPRPKAGPAGIGGTGGTGGTDIDRVTGITVPDDGSNWGTV